MLLAASINGDPYAQAAFDIVKDVRSAVDGVPGDEVLVGGNSAVGLDIAEASARDNLVVTPVVLLVVLVVLMLLLRSLAAPLLLIGTVILSFGAALGLSSLIFTQVLGYEATDAAFPLFAFVFLVALGIDYNIFLMTRVREEAAVHGTRKGSLIALSATGGVITSAGLVLAATFAALGTLPWSSPCSSASRWRSECCSTRWSCAPSWSPPSTSTSAAGSGGRASSTRATRRASPEVSRPTPRSPSPSDTRQQIRDHRVGRGITPAHARLPLVTMSDVTPTPQQVRRALARVERGAALDVAEATVLLAATGDDLDRLTTAAARVRDAGLVRAGRPGVVTYSPKVFIPVTKLCRDRCHYCTFVESRAS